MLIGWLIDLFCWRIVDCRNEDYNQHDRFAVAVTRGNEIVRHKHTSGNVGMAGGLESWVQSLPSIPALLLLHQVAIKNKLSCDIWYVNFHGNL